MSLRSMYQMRQVLLAGYHRITVCIIPQRCAGHSKWSNIKHIKAAKDGAKSIAFQKIGRLMRLSIQDGGNNPETNLQLSQAIQEAKKINMPMASIQAILTNAKKSKEKGEYKILDLKGPRGCAAFIVSYLTTNLSRNKQELQILAKKHKLSVSNGSALNMFISRGIVQTHIPPNCSLDDAVNHAVENGIDDVEEIDDEGQKYFLFSCDPVHVQGMRKRLQDLSYEIVAAEIDYVPKVHFTATNEELQFYSNLYEKLENLPDVINIHDNITWS